MIPESNFFILTVCIWIFRLVACDCSSRKAVSFEGQILTYLLIMVNHILAKGPCLLIVFILKRLDKGFQISNIALNKLDTSHSLCFPSVNIYLLGKLCILLLPSQLKNRCQEIMVFSISKFSACIIWQWFLSIILGFQSYNCSQDIYFMPCKFCTWLSSHINLLGPMAIGF